MIEIDYGKEAYVKLLELKKKVESIEKQLSKFHYNELKFNLGSDYNVTKWEQSFSLDALNEGKHYFKFKIDAQILNITGIVTEIYVNNVLCYTFANLIDGVYPFAISPTLIKGENTLKIVMNSAQEFDLNSCAVEVCGLVSYAKAYYSLSLATKGNMNYVIRKTPTATRVCYYYTDNSLKTVRILYNLKDAKIVAVDDNYLYFVVIQENDTAYLTKMSLSNFLIEEYPLNVSGVSSIAGYSFNGGIKILFCKLYSLYEGVFNLDTKTFTYSNTGKKAVKVYAESDCPNAFIITDKNNDSKFVSKNGNVITLAKGDNYHFIETHDGYDVEFTVNERIMKQSIIGLKTTREETVEYSSERLLLVTGKYLIRNREEVTIK